MINLNNFTIISKERTNDSSNLVMPMKPSILGYSPVFRINSFELGVDEAVRSGYSIRDYIHEYEYIPATYDSEKYNFVQHALALYFLTNSGPTRFIHDGVRSYRSTMRTNIETRAANSKALFETKFNEYCSSPIIYNRFVNSHVGYNTQAMANAFFNNYSYFDENALNYSHIKNPFMGANLDSYNHMQVGKGYVGLYNSLSKKSIPLVILMVKEEYVLYYRVANLLEMPIDLSMFEIWVNDELESNNIDNTGIILDFCKTNIFNKWSKESSNIPIKLKSGMTTYFDSIIQPKFKAISERSEWLSSLKNEFINTTYNPIEKLEVKEFEVDKPSITDSAKNLSSIRIKKAIKLSQEFGVIQPTNEAVLID